MSDSDSDTDPEQCGCCFDFSGTGAAADEVKANARECCLCDVLAQVCLMHEGSTGGSASLLFYNRLRGIHGLKIAVLGKGNTTTYRLISLSRDIPRLPFEIPVRKTVNLAPTIDEIAERISFWLSCCDETHKVCGTIGVMHGQTPARLLQLGTELNPTLRIVDFPGLETKFVALSYCWGNAEQVKLRNDKISEFRLAIPEDTLPRTIKDAITLTRKLGIGYIWIDALCIIQDNTQDWNVEASKMANVYGQAHVVLSADRGQNCDSGFLGARTRHYEVISVGPGESTQESMYAFVQEGNGVDTGERMHDFLLSGYLSEERLVASSPVYGRGWCLQEQTLAKRLIHFSDSEIAIECAEAIGCECEALSGEDWRNCLPFNPPELPPTPRKPYWHQIRALKDNSKILDAWWSCAEQYSATQLSVETDKLPAISGIAQSISDCGLGKYFAGIWEMNLPSGVLWATKRSFNANPRRLATYAAPSWSWASIIGPILRPDEPVLLPNSHEAEEDGGNTSIMPARAEVVDVEYEPMSVSLFGRIVRASLTLKATVITLTARSISEQGTWHDYFELYSSADDRESDADLIVPHYPLHSCGELDVFPSRESIELNAYLSTLDLRSVLIDYNGQGKGLQRANSFGALLVIPSDRENGTFERIGRVNLWIDGSWKLQAMDAKEIVLI